MEKQINLKELESKVYSSTFQDGLMDILLGIFFSQFAIAPLLTDIGFSDFEASAIFIPVYLIAFLFFYILRRFVSRPRMGVVRPSRQRKAKLIKVNIYLLLILFAGLLIGMLYPQFSAKVNIVFPMTFSLLLLALFTIAAFYLNLNRLYFYGIGLALAPLAGEILWQNSMASHHGYPAMFGIVSLISIITGIRYFTHFLRENPLNYAEKNNAG